MILFTAQGKRVELGAAVGHGGEATVYRVTSRVKDQQPGVRLAKIYEPQPREDYLRKLSWMLEHPPENPTAELHHASLAWPESLLYDDRRQLKGYCMPYIEHAVPILEVFNPRRRAVILPQFDRRYLHRTARNMAAAFNALHRSGYVAGDVNESNILVTPAALITLIDCDSFQVREKKAGKEILYPCPVGKPEYTPPELQGKLLGEVTRLPEHDGFGLGVLIFQLLMGGSHPFRAQWLGEGDPPPIEKRIADGAFPYAADPVQPVVPPLNAPGLDTLHPALNELFRRCFIDGHRSPRWRPGPELWARAVDDAEASLVCCAEGHFYAGHLASCPYCSPLARRVTPGLTPVRPMKERSSARKPARPNPAAGSTVTGNTPASPVGAGTNTLPGSQNTAIIAGQPAGSASAAVITAGMGALGTNPPGAAGVLRVHNSARAAARRDWLRSWLRNSLTTGGGQGAIAGTIPGALVAIFSWSFASPFNWYLLIALSGAAGGLLRGWQPGFRLAQLVDRTIGWKKYWQALGLLGGAVGGGWLGLKVEWAIVPVILGALLGAVSGSILGSKIWQLGSSLGWERVWGLAIALGAGGLGWGAAHLAGAAGLNSFGVQLAAGLQPFSGDGTFYSALLFLFSGSLIGALFGAAAGLLVDLLTRLARLTL